MSAKAILPGAVVMALLGILPLQAADPVVAPSPAPTVTAAPDSPIPAVTNGYPPGSVASPWPNEGVNTWGGVGRNGPIMSEFFTRAGVTLPTSGGTLNNFFETGWMFTVGGRSLFFNPAGSAAWAVDFGVSNAYNNANRTESLVLFEVQEVTLTSLIRTSFDVSVGREWFIFTPAFEPGSNARLGFDVGGRYGYERLEMRDLGTVTVTNPEPGSFHKGDVFGATFIALHTDVEVPLSYGQTFVAGFRAEWNYHFSDILPGYKCDMIDVNLLLNFGLRF